MHVPVSIGNLLYKMFASPTKQDSGLQFRTVSPWATQEENQLAEHVMTFDDFCAFCAVFRDPRDDEMLQIIFQILKLSPNFGRAV